jgi:[glutamine synthetase] adenylyltransferase / [glutamine synthetase]-adenylyl-L-tyrosine phosphorylase
MPLRYTAREMTRMTLEHLLPIVLPLCPEVDEEIVRDFVQRMDEDYLNEIEPRQIASHIRLAVCLDPDHPSRAACDRRLDGSLDLVIVAYDYFSEFAVICGLLASFGLDIREGRIFTSADPVTAPPARRDARPIRSRVPRKPDLTRKKIVDLFHVHPVTGTLFTPTHEEQFAQELESMLRLLDSQRFQEARHRVNRRLVETLDRTRRGFTGLLHPVRIDFDNHHSPTDTVIEIRSMDTPAFLYAFANALAMRGVYIRTARFEQIGAELHDRFFVRGRHGRKIEEASDQQELRLTATFIKQFTHFLTWAPDPAKALDHFDRFLDQLLEGGRTGRALDFLKEQKTLATLARLLGTSDFLWEDFLRRQHANLLPMLETYQHLPLVRPKADMVRELRKRIASVRSDEQRRRALNQYKDEEMFRIDMKHLLDPNSTLVDFSRGLSDLADVVLDQAIRDCQAKLSHPYGAPRQEDGAACPFAVFGMGKFGGRELGYASDVEILFVYGGAGTTSGKQPLENSEYFERLAQEILSWIDAKQEGIFHLDVRLRPHGSKGSLANSLAEIERYYSPAGLAAPFERQALIKLRYVGGDEALGQTVEVHRDAYVYSKLPWDVEAALDLRRRQVKEFVESNQINIKYSPGCLIDIEYGVQYLQIQHGHRHPSFRTQNTMLALDALGQKNVLSKQEVQTLHDAYLFFRLLIDGLRIVRGHAKDLVLPPRDSEGFVFLARRVGYTTETWEEGAKKLDLDIRRHMVVTREFFTTRFGPIET